MTDKIALAAVTAAGGVAGWNWLAAANDIATLAVTVLAALGALAAALYQFERFRKLRRQRKENE